MVSSSGNVGIGTTNPATLLHIYGNIYGDPSLVIEDINSDTYLAIKSGITKNSILSFDDAVTRRGEINYDHNIDEMGI
jgi:hypothetical protein